MAASKKKHELQSAQEHIPTCEKHNFTIDITCEDCDEFICSQCAKTDHKDHDWKTIPTAGSLRRRELKKTMCKIKEEDVKTMDEKVQKAAKLMENIQKCCDSEISKLQKHYNAIVSKLDEIAKHFETKLRENLKTKNAKVSEKKVNLEKKTEHITDLLKFLEEKHNTMSDYSLIDNLRDLTNLVSNTDSEKEKGDFSLRYKIGHIREGSLESMMGQTFDFDDINVTERDAFQYDENEDNALVVVHAINDDTCFVQDNSKCFQQINMKNKKKEEKYNINVNGICVTDNGNVYATNNENDSIVCLSPSDSVSTVFSTDPLEPGGICQSTEGGLLVTLGDNESEPYQPVSHSRRLVRHVTLTGDVIREYEYQEDGQTRLFTLPVRVRQNGNTDICVVNWTGDTSSELVILSLSGSLKLIYRGQDIEECRIIDVLCDSHCNIITCEGFYSQIHLLSPDGEFLKYLLTETEVTHPMSMSLYKSTLWVGNAHGLLKVFQYKSKNIINDEV
ncbi:uncharacterized protein [Magallana gigas]|uniref:uncharacterized protein n=1 Tax=Magallana gigas TaxID=29159 RepID=UPI00334138B5